MITPAEEEFIAREAYVPEHLPGYGKVFSGGEPFLSGDCICYLRETNLIFVGYPLDEPYDEKKMQTLWAGALKKFRPSRAVLLAPSGPEQYYRLDLGPLRIPPKVENMTRRAGRELQIRKGREFGAEHRKLVDDFLASREVEEGTRTIFSRIGDYVSSVPTAWIYEARDSGGCLAGFDVADFGARDYAFYLFNFRGRTPAVPGTSDLLLQALVLEARERGKSFVNLGLGINPGVTFFKRKWGGRPFLRHGAVFVPPSRPSFWQSIFEGMMRR